ncbi:MAG: sigma-54-dependent Fis family transcriptional regulator [Candidatus Cloacimonetes bacterium]|nr:sigma-54 dependent transcriptional regulator [Candidatus Cloacimonadota bacterium]NLO11736.1 sigma-54-dependent Fis family transcriptional regulator [Candidatus Cloacimonadota bacterium]
MKGKVILLEDDLVLATQIGRVLERYDYQMLHATNSDDFFEELRNFSPDVVLLDVFLVGSRLNGLQVLRYLKENLDLNYKIIVISGEVNSSQIEEIRQLGAYHFIEKGVNFSAHQLLLHIDNAVALKRQEEEHIGLQIDYINLKKQFMRRFPFIGESEAIRNMREQLIRLASMDEDVLLIGETGTGKEVAAYYYYINSQRFGNAFHTVYCSTLTDNSLEYELFGAVQSKGNPQLGGNTGFFEECSDGVLFLDEITNLSPSSQAKLLRAIETKEIQVVNGALKKVNTRLIFTSNASLEELSQSQRFRPDFYFRIEGSVVEIPPLRERGDDILLLMNYFFTNYASRFNINQSLNLEELSEALHSYDWPGNVRELQNFCKTIIINEPEITNAAIIKHLQNKKTLQRNVGGSNLERFFAITNIKQSTAAFEREYLLHFLEQYNWQVSKTAAEIGIERTTLYKKMKQLGINLEEGI